MALRKCPRCELNYILEGGPYCTVCTREMKGDSAGESLYEICSVCNENPCLPGKDMCLFCLKEMEKAAEAMTMEESFENPLEPEEVSEMEEIAVDAEDDIPGPELGEIDRELSLDDVLADEALLDDDENGSEEEDV